MERYIRKFKEKLLDIQRIQGIDSLKDTEIYVNPKSTSSLPKGVRGIIDKKGNMYVWDNLNVIHVEIFPYLINNNLISLPDSYKRPKYKMINDTLNYGIVAIQESLSQKGVFSYSESYGYDLSEKDKNKIKLIFNKAKKKNPQFDFINDHFWRESLYNFNKIKKYKSRFKEKQELFYNYRRNKRQLDEPVIFCVDNAESSRHYGNIQRVFKATRKTLDLRNKNNTKVKQLVKHCQDFLNEWLEVDKLNEPEVSFLAGYNAINPNDIVDSAGAWDNIEFINYLYDETNFFDHHDGVITNDGAVFFEVTKDNLVSMTDLSD